MATNSNQFKQDSKVKTFKSFDSDLNFNSNCFRAHCYSPLSSLLAALLYSKPKDTYTRMIHTYVYTNLIAAGHKVVPEFFNDRCGLLWLYRVFVKRNNYRLRRLHAVDADFAKLCPYHSIRTWQVNVPVAGQGNTRRRQNILLVESLDQFCQLFFTYLCTEIIFIFVQKSIQIHI